MKIVSRDVETDDGDKQLRVGDKIGGKEISRIIPITEFKVNPTDGSTQVDYGHVEDDTGNYVDHGLEFVLNDGTRLFIPSNRMNEALIEGTFGRKTAGPYDTRDYSTKFHAKYSDEITIATLLCFFPGTLIATPVGERMIEELVPGDRVLTKNGREVAAKWICRQTVSTRFGPAERLMPVRFAAGSLGDGSPHSDLTVTADHAVLLDDVLCEAGALVNGTTITRIPLSEFGEGYTVYHLEADAHEVVLANGTPVETFVDNASRMAFDNYAEHEALYGANTAEMEELPYPRASNARHLPARIKSRLFIGVEEETGKVA